MKKGPHSRHIHVIISLSSTVWVYAPSTAIKPKLSFKTLAEFDPSRHMEMLSLTIPKKATPKHRPYLVQTGCLLTARPRSLKAAG